MSNLINQAKWVVKKTQLPNARSSRLQSMLVPNLFFANETDVESFFVKLHSKNKTKMQSFFFVNDASVHLAQRSRETRDEKGVL
jgi:hypothetical protein